MPDTPFRETVAATSEVARALAVTEPLPGAVLGLICKRALELSHAGAVIIWVPDENGGDLRPAEWCGRVPDEIADARIAPPLSTSGAALHSIAAVVTDDLAPDSPEAAAVAGAMEARAGVFVPVAGEGVLSALYAEPSVPSYEWIDAVECFAGLAGCAVRLAEQREAHERAALASRLHDTAIQLLYAAELALSGRSPDLPGDLQREVAFTAQNIRDAIKRLRDKSAYGRAPTETLGERLGKIAALLGERIPIEVTVTGPEVTAADPRTSDLGRIALEAVANAVRHAHAAHIDIEVTSGGGLASLTIRDDGDGFDTESATKGLGLTLMPRRAERIGAEFTLVSNPGRGTQITVTAPAGKAPA